MPSPRIFALVALLIAFAPHARAAPMEADAGPAIATAVRATPPAATAPVPAPADLAPAAASPTVISWLRAGDPPNWQVIAAFLWLALTAILKASSRLRANEPLELLANALVRVPLVGQLARWWTTPGRPEPAREPRDPGMPAAGAALVLALLSAWLALPGCASYTATQTRACVSASIAAAKDDVAAIRACLQTGAEHPTDEAITGCVETSAQAALSDANAVLACVPEVTAAAPVTR